MRPTPIRLPRPTQPFGSRRRCMHRKRADLGCGSTTSSTTEQERGARIQTRAAHIRIAIRQMRESADAHTCGQPHVRLVSRFASATPPNLCASLFSSVFAASPQRL
eukprot:1075736-Pleurochrysis_carterae.AAC.1